MADNPLTLEKMLRGSQNLDIWDAATNGDENTDWTNLVGDKGPSLKKAIKELFENGGIAGRFKTLAQLQASSLADGAYALVADDAIDKNGIYIKEAGAWKKSAYDPLTQSLAYTDLKVEFSSAGNKLLELKDTKGMPVIIIDSHGSIFAPQIDGSLQGAIKKANEVNDSIGKGTENHILSLKDANGDSVFIINKKGDIFATGLGKPIQSYLKNLSANQNGNSTLVTVEGNNAVGKALYATLPKGFFADSYQWQKNGEDIDGATKSFYVLGADDLYADISVKAEKLKGGHEVFDNSGVTIGGIALEQEGAVGTIYEGYKLSAGDDFTELDIIAPHKPLGKWFTTRTYLYAPRGSDTLLGTMYDTDPYHTGHNDSNRGKPVGYNNMSVKNSVLTLTARKATSEEKKHFQGT